MRGPVNYQSVSELLAGRGRGRPLFRPRPPQPPGPPTPRQAEVYLVLVRYWKATGAMPTLRELCALTGCASTNGADVNLKALARKGLLRRREGGGAHAYVFAGLTFEPRFDDTPAGQAAGAIWAKAGAEEGAPARATDQPEGG
jgi:hypothetical protein